MIDLGPLKIDALLVSHLPNVRYLTGFTGSNGVALVTGDSVTLFTDPRYTIQASEEVRCQVRIAKGPLVKDVCATIKRKRFQRIGFEKSHMTWEAWDALKNALPLGAGLKPVGRVVEQLRMLKSPEEIALIRASVNANSEAFEGAVKKIRPGLSESGLAAEIEHQMRRRGAEKPAFDTIVASGVRTALPHAQPTGQRLRENEIVLIDMGATRSGYTSDMTRMVFLGKPQPKMRLLYQAVLEAQLTAVNVVRDGVTAEHVDRAARQVLKAHGLDRAFVHSTGHGLGLEIHEAPRLGKKDKTPLQAGMVVTIEPGVYVQGTGGIRIEDTILVTDKGCEVLTPTSKELMIL
jgi:Xaa-Pro aminopeptidase